MSYISAPGTFIKSIQRGVLTIPSGSSSATATITSVDTANSVLHISQDGDGIVDRWDASLAYVVFTNATTLTATRTGTTGDAVRTSYHVVEYIPGFLKSIQRGTIALTGVSSNTATITSVDTSKSVLIFLGMLTAELSSPQRITTRLTLTDATTVTASRAVGTGNNTISYQVVEHY